MDRCGKLRIRLDKLLAQGGHAVSCPFGLDTWDTDAYGRCFVHIVNSETWRKITGEPVPPSPVTAQAYKDHGYPWFGLYDEELTAIPASKTLGDVKSVDELDPHRVGDGTW